MEKQWYESKVLWVAVLQALAGIFVAITTNYPEMGWAMVGKSIVDALLRVVTVAPLGGRLGRLGKRLSGKE